MTALSPRLDAAQAAAGEPQWSYRGEGIKAGRRFELARLFEWPARERANEPAIADGAVSLTFAQLERCASELARLLHAAGVASGERVLVLSEKRAVMAAVAGGIWKAGAVYVPFDAEAPAGRLDDVLRQATPKAVVGSKRALQAHAAILSCPPAARICFESVLEQLQSPGAGQPLELPRIDETAAAYIIFTSGSTGAPKGVVISHGSLLDYFYNHNQVLRFTPTSRVFSLAPFHFDVSIEDTLLPLSLGAYVFQYRGLPLGPLLRKALRRERVTHLIAVSTLLALITGDGNDVSEQSFPELRMVMTGAEVCDPKLIDLWVQRLPQARVINAYGPTEATIVCLTHTIDRTEPVSGASYPIGKPLPGVEVLLLDDANRAICTAGVTGELLIGGSQVMLGYLGRSTETELACPIIDGKRYYRSGDRCFFDAHGRVVYLERMDDMIKIGGQRVHLGEIRQRTLGLPGVLRAAVGELRLEGHAAIALAVVIQGFTEDPAAYALAGRQIREALQAHLPEYMLPRVLVLTSEAQLTSSGKTDERGLLEKIRQAAPRGHGNFMCAADGALLPLSEAKP